MEPEKMLRIGGYTGIVAAVMTIVGPLIYSIYIAPAIAAENLETLAAWLILLAGISTILTGLVYILFGLGFQGGAKKFGKGIGTGAFVMALLAGIGLIMMGLGIPGLLAALAAGEIGAAVGALLLVGIGALLYALFAFIFSILVIIYFFGTEKGTLGGVGGILYFVGSLAGIAIPIAGQIMVIVGLLLMGICLLKQAKI